MKRLSISEAVAISPVGETTLRKHIKSGKLSAERDARGHYKIDATELARVYGTGHLIDTELLIQSYQNRIQDLNRQLDVSNQRETTLTAERSQLLNMLSVEQEKTRLLLPAPEQRGWIRRWLGFGEA